jgi:hypothetical protein
METIHAWCLENGLTSALLNASAEGRPLYESLGYALTVSPLMSKGISTGDAPGD